MRARYFKAPKKNRKNSISFDRTRTHAPVKLIEINHKLKNLLKTTSRQAGAVLRRAKWGRAEEPERGSGCRGRPKGAPRPEGPGGALRAPMARPERRRSSEVPPGAPWRRTAPSLGENTAEEIIKNGQKHGEIGNFWQN